MPAGLTKISLEEFEASVNADIRGTADPATSAMLRETENLNLWYDTLAKMKRAVEAQLTSSRSTLLTNQAELLGKGSHDAWLEAKASTERWRQGAIRFKNGVEERLAEAKRLRMMENSNSFITSLVNDRDRAIAESVKLREAIEAHRTAVLAEDLDEDPEMIDDRLWSVLG